LKSNFLKWVILVLIVLVSIETGSYFLYQWQKQPKTGAAPEELTRIYQRYGVDLAVFGKEIDRLFNHSPRYHPYRWYRLEKNFRGQYVTTDENGFRIDRNQINPNADVIACFGGSTLFSSGTADNETIPYFLNSLMNNRRVNCLNFGGGGYSSTTDLILDYAARIGVKQVNYMI
jgi:hypothetical protein